MLNLLGEYEVRLDAKGRLVLPAGLKKQLESALSKGFVVNRDVFQPCLVLYPHAVWEKVRDQVNALPRVKKPSRILQLKLVGAAEFVEPDGNARISIPASHRNAAGIERKAVLVGMGDKFELWSEADHLAQIRQPLGDEDLGDEFQELML